jgi:hypothetical protein
MKRESRYVRVARIAYQLTQRTLPQYTHAKSPHRFTFPQLAACVLLMFYLDLSYRDMEEWLLASDQVCKELGLSRVPDYSTLQRAYAKLRVKDFTQMKDELLQALGVEESAIAADSTGFSPGQASLYYQTRTGRLYQRWWKGVYAVGISSLFILAWRFGFGPGSDVGYLSGLRKEARRYAKGHTPLVVLADQGFDGRSLRPEDLSPPIRKRGKLLSPERRAREELVQQARLDGFYGQRWKSETVMSVIKRKFGDSIRSRKAQLQNREPIVKGLVYNFHL